MNSNPNEPAVEGRLLSLDALRGFDMFWIIGGSMIFRSLVQATGSQSLRWIPDQLTHVPWEGFHFIDLIFPLFLFMIGVSIPYSFAKRLARGDGPRRLYGHILRRVAVLVVLGMMVNGNLLSYDPHQFHITYSVLQMLALGYLVASVLYLNLRLPGQIAATAAMLIGYWLLLAFVPVPGHQPGVFKPYCNLGDWLNDLLLGRFQGRWRLGWIVGILGHASTAMLGVFAGQLLRAPKSNAWKLAWLVALGLGCLAIAYAWSGWLAEDLAKIGWAESTREWPVWFPIIKNRWTSTFALYAGGLSYLLLALFYLVIDVWKIRRWAFPFVVIGSNSIVAYMCGTIGCDVFRVAGGVFLGGLRPYVGTAWNGPITWVGATAVLWLVLWYMYRNKTFIRV